MKWILVFLIGALIYKDVSHLIILDRYVLRGLSQGIALVVGFMWLAGNMSPIMIRRYWPALLYIFALLLSMASSSDPLNVFIQILSVSAFILFTIAYADFSRIRAIQRPNNPLIYSTAIMLAAVLLSSLILIKVQPSMAYDLTYIGERRFSGVFGEPALMGVAAGLAVGIAFFGIREKWLKLMVLLVAIPCLALTLSRTFWIATVFSGLLTAWFYYPRTKKVVALATMAVITIIAIMFIFGIKMETQEEAKIARVDSISTMSGRTVIWEHAYQAFLKSPVIGHGFTKGVDATFSGNQTKEVTIFNAESNSGSGGTLHSGYVQSLVDSGLLGFIAYMAFIIIPILRLMKYDADREYVTEYFILIYLMVGNVAESTIYSGATLAGGIFWITAVSGLSIKPKPVSREGGARKFVRVIGA